MTPRRALKKYFGYGKFRAQQEEIVRHVLAGQDCFVLMPTGGGKSLCYQLPAVILPGVTLVVSPLIALMKDQVDSLRARGIAAEFINSSLTAKRVSEISEQVQENKIKILYISPERLALPDFQEFLKGLDVSLVAVDEAHCISEWGHDFRPDYLELSRLKTFFPGAPLIALTATATPETRGDIFKSLGIKAAAVFASGFDRKNLTIRVENKTEPFRQLVGLIEKYHQRSIIIYCHSRRETEELSDRLGRHGFKARAYHAGLSQDERRLSQELFLAGAVDIIAATIAFGMGIDKPDVRLVVHYTLPKTLEGYYQEIGRAGRDGRPAECVMFFAFSDIGKHKYFIGRIEDARLRRRAEVKLDAVVAFAEINTCRRQYILSYFGEQSGQKKCRSCDACLARKKTFNAGPIVRKILSAVKRTGERFGENHIIDLLLGRPVRKILIYKHEKLASFGAGKNFSEPDLRRLIKIMVDKDLLVRNEGMYPTLSIGRAGAQLLEKKSILVLPEFTRSPIGFSAQSRDDSLGIRTMKVLSDEERFYQRTKELIAKKIPIKRIAKSQDLPIEAVVNHIEKLLDDGARLDLEYLKLPQDRFRAMSLGFKKCGDSKLKPVFEFLQSKFSYDELRLARLLRRV